MVSFNTTNLGDQAQTTRLLTSSISALNYQQPFQQIGSLTNPIPLNLLAQTVYIPGFNKYILYMLAPASGVSFDTTFSVINFPVNLVESYTILGTVNWILSGTGVVLTTKPIHTDSVTVSDDTITGTSIKLQITDIASPVYTVGTAIYKFTISINLE